MKTLTRKLAIAGAAVLVTAGALGSTAAMASSNLGGPYCRYVLGHIICF